MSRAVSRTLSNIYDFEQIWANWPQISQKSLVRFTWDLFVVFMSLSLLCCLYRLFMFLCHIYLRQPFSCSSCDDFTTIYLESNTKTQLIISVWSIFWVSTYWCILVHTTVNQKKSYFAEYCGQIFTSQDF